MNNKIQKTAISTKNNDPLSKTEELMKSYNKSMSSLVMPRLFYQLVVFVLDGSDSMNWESISGNSKGEEVESAIKGILRRLQKSKNKESFDINIWAYSEEISEIVPTTSVTKIDLDQDLNPCTHVQNTRTYIADALEETERVVEDYLETNKNKNTQALILILSDGALHDLAEAKECTDRLKSRNNITISSYLFEDKRWKDELPEEELEDLRNDLKSLSSHSTDSLVFFKSTVDPEEVRKHMIKSISEISKPQ